MQRRIRFKTLKAILQRFIAGIAMKENLDDLIGSYLISGYRIQISKHNLSTSQRVMQLYKRRRLAGECIQCGKKVKRKNPRTGKLYRLCDHHRKIIDHKS